METKLIIIAENDIRKLTFNEIFKMYKGLIDKKANMWSQNYEFDDMVQVASIALWKAYKNYDIKKPVGFGLLAKRYIERALLRHNQLNKPKTQNSTSKVKLIMSMEEKVFTDSNGKGLTLQELLSGGDSFQEQVIENMILNKVLKKLNKNQKKHLSFILQGYSSRELAEIEGIKIGTMSARRVQLMKKLRNLYNEETSPEVNLLNSNLSYKSIAV